MLAHYNHSEVPTPRPIQKGVPLLQLFLSLLTAIILFVTPRRETFPIEIRMNRFLLRISGDGSITLLLVLNTVFNESVPCTTKNPPTNCLITDLPTPTYTSSGPETTIVEHLKTSQFRCCLSHTTKQPAL
ncbi:hypothetical protein CSKR_103458 [Clonorchis sinensis]|uniref:Uncharacterized protein n=1 Tax=Clonorchis sinensis TaxID=79923 RepID=A0A3R7F9Q0_CLOSI|nr:hypothetical protein CSKR_103458 [Clonorchis sinensis]